MGVLAFGIPRARGSSRGNRQCECTNKLTTLLTTEESKIQDNHKLIMHVFAFIKGRKTDKIWIVQRDPEALKLMNILSG